MTRLMQYLIVVLSFCAILPAAYALDGSGSTDAEVAKYCDAATARLAALQAQEDVPWSAQTESGELIRTWSSPECTAHRRKGAFDVRSEMEKATQLLSKSGIDVGGSLKSDIQRCSQSIVKKWEMETDSFRKQNSKQELFETCSLNAWQTVYAQALVFSYKLDQQRVKAEYELAMSKHNEAIRLQKEQEAVEKAAYDAEVAANKVKYEKELADWQLCKDGKRKYCKKQD